VVSLLAPLYVQLMSICVNGVPPSLKLASALKSARRDKAIFHRKTDAEDWCAKTGGRIRMMAAKYRQVELDEDSYAKCMARAWGLHTKRSIQQLKKTLGLHRVWKCC